MELHSAGTQAGEHSPAGFGSGRDGGLSESDITTAARAARCVLLTGPADKTLALARRIHEKSSRREGPFTVIDCARSAPHLIGPLVEALDDGSATPPRTTQAGSLYLQNVGQMPLDVQRTLADLLVRPGRSRVIASTPWPLLNQVADGEFDDCLYYRLNLIHIMMA